jgi:hypothetical protein
MGVVNDYIAISKSMKNIPAMNKVMRAGDLKKTLALIANLFSLLLVLVDFILSP